MTGRTGRFGPRLRRSVSILLYLLRPISRRPGPDIKVFKLNKLPRSMSSIATNGEWARARKLTMNAFQSFWRFELKSSSACRTRSKDYSKQFGQVEHRCRRPADSHLDPRNRRQHLRRQQLDRIRHLGKGQAAYVDLAEEAVVAEQLVLVHQLVDDLLRAADEGRAVGRDALVVQLARHVGGQIGARRVRAEVGAVVRI